MKDNKAVTYSLLAHIRNSGTLVKGPLDIFVPLIKRVLHRLSVEGKGKSDTIFGIQKKAIEIYSIDFPLPALKLVLKKIEDELNTYDCTRFQLFADGAYILKDYVFDDFEEMLQNSQQEVKKLEKLFKDFCQIHLEDNHETTSILDFIDKNRRTLSKYLTNQVVKNGEKFSIEAKFVEFFKQSPPIYEIIRNIYLGSILTCYIEYKTENSKGDVELLFDTNFLVSLLDLNTPESTHTCNKLLEVCKKMGYHFSVLTDTIAETKGLIRSKADHFSNTFLQKRINPEDIYNACARRKLSRADLERIADNLEDKLGSIGISIIHDTASYRNKARFSSEYEFFKTIRNSDKAALHDVTALYYVKEKRKNKAVKEFESVKCWFVNNSMSPETVIKSAVYRDYQPETIKADELLNILWLSNPQVATKLSDADLADIGLSALVAFTLNQSLPKASIIRELDENIQRYAGEELSDKDIINLSTRIVNHQLYDIEQLNELAQKDSGEFLRKLQEAAKLQEEEEKERLKQFEAVMKKVDLQITSFEKAKQQLTAKEAKFQIEQEAAARIQNEYNASLLKKDSDLAAALAKLEEQYKDKQVRKWRLTSWCQFLGCVVLLIFFFLTIIVLNNFDINKAETALERLYENRIISMILSLIYLGFSSWIFWGLVQKYHNHSNIEAFRRSIKMPKDGL